MDIPKVFGIIAGNGAYPELMAGNARSAGVERIVVAAFENETRPVMAELADEIEWMRVGQLRRLLKFFKTRGVTQAVMAGQIAPKNLFDLRPDVKTLVMLGRLKRRNAETIFGAIADEMAKAGVTLVKATTFMEDSLASEGVLFGLALSHRESGDIEFGFAIAKEVSRLDIGQTVVVKSGTVLAVEAFEGTNETILRGGKLGRGEAVVVKVSKPGQDLRFDVPCIGRQTLETAREAGVRVLALETGSCLILERDAVAKAADEYGITVYGVSTSQP